jgi:hypothetical protein
VNGYLFVTQGDATQLSAHAICYSATTTLDPTSDIYSAFREQLPGSVGQFLARLITAFRHTERLADARAIQRKLDT